MRLFMAAKETLDDVLRIFSLWSSVMQILIRSFQIKTPAADEIFEIDNTSA